MTRVRCGSTTCPRWWSPAPPLSAGWWTPQPCSCGRNCRSDCNSAPRQCSCSLQRSWCMVPSSVADPGCLSWIPDPTFFHPGSRIRTVLIPDPGSRILIKECKYFNPQKSKKKWFLSSKKYDPGCSSRIPDPDADFLPSRIPDPGVKKVPNPGSGSATLVPSHGVTLLPRSKNTRKKRKYIN